MQSYAMFQSRGPSTEPCGTPASTLLRCDCPLTSLKDFGIWLSLKHLLKSMLRISNISSGAAIQILLVIPSGPGALFFGFLYPFLPKMTSLISDEDIRCSFWTIVVSFF